jgi:hypothetical protein
MQHGSDQDLPESVREAADAGRLIEAIRRLREAEGVGLREARDRVAAYVGAERRVPDRPSPPREESTLSRFLLVLGVGGLLLLAWLGYGG